MFLCQNRDKEQNSYVSLKSINVIYSLCSLLLFRKYFHPLAMSDNLHKISWPNEKTIKFLSHALPLSNYCYEYLYRFYDEGIAKQNKFWISPYTTVLDSYLLKLSRGYVAQGSLASVKVDAVTSKVEVTTNDGAQIKLTKVRHYIYLKLNERKEQECLCFNQCFI